MRTTLLLLALLFIVGGCSDIQNHKDEFDKLRAVRHRTCLVNNYRYCQIVIGRLRHCKTSLDRTSVSINCAVFDEIRRELKK